MGNLHFSDVFFFTFFFFHYVVADQYFINCGSSDSSTVNGQNFVGDQNPTSFSLSRQDSSAVTNPSTNLSSPLYGTARIFRRESWYELDISQSGTYVVRFHFYAFTSQAQGVDLFSARFNVSTPNFYLLSDFSVQNNTNTSNSPKEFLFNITSGKFRIYFTPSASSMAFVNAIEALTAPAGLILDSAPRVSPAGSSNNEFNGLFSKALQVIHRINVGGGQVPPEADGLGRTWIPDDEYMYPSGAAVNTLPRNGPPSWSTLHIPPPRILARDSNSAPDRVYNSAKVLGRNSVRASWGLRVNRSSMFFVRAHFCDIVSGAGSDNLTFNLSLYNFGQLVDPHTDIWELAVPFYLDFVVDSDDSGFMNISMVPRPDSGSQTAFLNGLEIMELINNSSSIPRQNEPSQASNKHLFAIIGSVVGGFVVIIASAILLWYYLRVKKGEPLQTLDEWQQMDLNRSSYSRSTERNVNGTPLLDLNLGLKMALDEILLATKNFNEKLVIGEGGFGKVYKGILMNGTKVAVKRSEPGKTQGLSEFRTEIMVLSQINHRHLVSLIGYCDERSEMVLVYEFMEKGALKDHLYGSNEKSTKPITQSRLSWEKRLELCIEAAKGLHYLHTCLGGKIIHRDVKSSNILLDEHYRAKVADFGISRLSPLDQTHVSTEVKGTFGYLDPEYCRCFVLTQKSDVYSFGVVLLEVLCARPPLDNSLPGQQINLADWGLTCMKKGELETIVDPFLAGKIAPDSLRTFEQIVQRCLREYGDDRPNMVDLLWNLQYALQLQQTKAPSHPQEDNSEVSYNALQPVIARLPSYSMAISEDESDTQMNGSNTSASAVFSQIMVQEAR